MNFEQKKILLKNIRREQIFSFLFPPLPFLKAIDSDFFQENCLMNFAEAFQNRNQALREMVDVMLLGITLKRAKRPEEGYPRIKPLDIYFQAQLADDSLDRMTDVPELFLKYGNAISQIQGYKIEEVTIDGSPAHVALGPSDVLNNVISEIENYLSKTGATARPDLTAAIGDIAQQQYVGTKILTPVYADRKSGSFAKINAADYMHQLQLQRAANAAYNRSHLNYDAEPYSCVEYGIEHPIDDSEEAMTRTFFDAELLALKAGGEYILRAQEKRIYDILDALDKNTLGTDWATVASADPIADIETGKSAIRDAVGISPNTLVLSRAAFLLCIRIDAVVELIKYNNSEFAKGSRVTPNILAALFGVDHVLIGDVIQNTTEPGVSASLGNIWPDDFACLAVAAPLGSSVKEISLGRTIVWADDSAPGSDEYLVTAETYRDETIRSNVVRCRQHCDEVIILESAAYVMDGITA